MATFKELTANDFKTNRSFLDQIVDVIQNDISGSTSRQTFAHFVTGGVGPGVTSSLWQTIFDQDFSLETANPVLDITMGLFASSSIIDSAKLGEDSNGKFLFPSTSLMMREKIFMYQQHAQKLLGDADAQFTAPVASSDTADEINAALFIDLKRLFARDQVKRETFIMGLFESASVGANTSAVAGTAQNVDAIPSEFALNDPSGFKVFTDIGAASNKEVTFGGQVSDVVDASDTSISVGLLFNDAGILVLDLERVLDANQVITGAIDAMATGEFDVPEGQRTISASFSPNFLTSASLDDFIKHITTTRFGSGTLSATTFQNITNINSTIITTRLGADEFNYSSNPTYTDVDNRIIVIDEGQEETQKSFTMVTTLGFFDANDNLLAVAKFSRPVEKNDERDLLFRTRLDF